MGLNKALEFLKTHAKIKPQKGGSVQSHDYGQIALNQQAFNRANKLALDAVADYAVSAVKKMLSRPYPPSSRPGESPHKRTGTLQESIHWREGSPSRQFPGPVPRSTKKNDITRFKRAEPQKYAWYKQIRDKAYGDRSLITPYPPAILPQSNTRVIEVDPSAPDRSDRQRLEYYSYYLETGWYSRPNDEFRDKKPANAEPGERVKRKKPKNNVGLGGWNPPRPFLRKLDSPHHKGVMSAIYREVLKRELSEEMRDAAFRAKLKVTYNHSLRVPFASANKHLMG